MLMCAKPCYGACILPCIKLGITSRIVCPFVCTDAGATSQSGFTVLGAEGSDCPTYYHRIPSTQAFLCKSLAADLGLTYQGTYSGSDFPSGCFLINPTDVDVYHNTATTGSQRPTTKLLCTGARLSLAAVLERERGKPRVHTNNPARTHTSTHAPTTTRAHKRILAGTLGTAPY
jgi:hypothetical protein